MQRRKKENKIKLLYYKDDSKNHIFYVKDIFHLFNTLCLSSCYNNNNIASKLAATYTQILLLSYIYINQFYKKYPIPYIYFFCPGEVKYNSKIILRHSHKSN